MKALQSELAHVQRVGGTSEVDLLLAIGILGSHGDEELTGISAAAFKRSILCEALGRNRNGVLAHIQRMLKSLGENHIARLLVKRINIDDLQGASAATPAPGASTLGLLSDTQTRDIDAFYDEVRQLAREAQCRKLQSVDACIESLSFHRDHPDHI